MATQNHIIKKQVLDLTLDSEVGSFIFQSRASEVFKTKILPLIDDHCSRISPESGTIRIDRLEIDLGVVGRNSFESDFKMKFDKIFPVQLANALRISPGEQVLFAFGDEVTSGKPDVIPDEVRDFEILEFFIREGRLPWWVRVNESHNIRALLTQCIISQRAKVKNLIAGIAGNPLMVKRLVYQVEGSSLERILEFFQPGYVQEIYNLSQNLMTQLDEYLLVQGIGSSKIRPELWSCVICWSVAAEGRIFEQQKLVETIVRHLADNFDLDFKALYDYVIKKTKMKDKSVFSKYTHGVAKKAYHVTDLKVEEYAQYLLNLENLFKELQSALMICKTITVSTFFMRWHLDRLTKKVSRGLKSILHIQKMLDQIRESVSETSIAGVDGDLRRQAEKLGKSLEKLRVDIEALLHRDLSKMDFEIVKNIENLVKTMDESGKELAIQTRLTFMDADNDGDKAEIFVNNAGIILLWPYLAKFFEAIGLTKEDHFIDEEAAGRAVSFLHYLANGTTAAQEYELVLNKILCGIESDNPVNPYLEMTQEDVTECENLLRSVIQNWPALKNTSASGLRKMFLMREGMIFYRDGHPVLRVAGQAYDILLDKMSWGIGTIKLPWMRQLLFVEWRQ